MSPAGSMLFLGLLTLLLASWQVECWSPPPSSGKTGRNVELQVGVDKETVGFALRALTSPSTSRHEFLQKTWSGIGAAFLFGGVLTNHPSQSVASSVPSSSELKKLQVGHGRVQYLLNHWDEITSSCRTSALSDLEKKQVVRTEGGGGAGCDKTPLRVQEFLGYKSTEDPLFRADKLMIRAAQLVEDPDDLENYLDVVEKYREKADQGATLAYTSSWGEANPNGGKEVVDDYLEKTKIEVEQTETYLRKILGYLNLEIIPERM